MKITTKLSILFGLALLISSQAQAAIVQFTLSGEITFATDGNPFALSTGDTISASGFFDDTTFTDGTTPGITLIDFSTTSNNMEIIVGNTFYTDADDEFGGGIMFFNNGIIDGLTYLSVTFDKNAFDSADTFGFYETDFGGTGIAGNWDASSYTAVSAVPVPAAVWLFSTGLLSLGVFSRRKRIL